MTAIKPSVKYCRDLPHQGLAERFRSTISKLVRSLDCKILDLAPGNDTICALVDSKASSHFDTLITFYISYIFEQTALFLIYIIIFWY